MDEPTRHIGQSGPLDDPEPTESFRPRFGPTRSFGPTEWFGPPEQPPATHAPMWRRRGPLAAAGVLVLSIVGLVIGIVLSAPAPIPANTAVVAPATATAQPAAGHRKAARHRRRQPTTPVPTVTSVSHP
jgi:hypothetical protein